MDERLTTLVLSSIDSKELSEFHGHILAGSRD
jgi:hypothetical protein